MTKRPKANRRLALLIDAENIGPEFADPLMAKARTLGSIVLAKVYGNPQAERVVRWNLLAGKFGLETVSAPKNGKKNSADFRLVIDAMSMLHTAPVDGFCIASGDSDFVSLAEQIKERSKALFVFAVGASTSAAYRGVAGTNFFDLTQLETPALQSDRRDGSSDARTTTQRNGPSVSAAPSDALIEKIAAAILQSEPDAEGWALLSSVGQVLGPAFSKPYKYRTLKPLLVAMPNHFEIRQTEKGADLVRRKFV